MASMNTPVSLFMVYQFLRRLATPFNKWKAYKAGVIDERGNILLKAKERTTIEQRESFTKFDVLVLKLKRLLEKVPGGKSRLASYAAALYLIKEDWDQYSIEELEDEDIGEKYYQLLEDAPVNNVSDGEIAGGGFNGPEDIKVDRKKRKKHYKEKNAEEAPRLRKFSSYL